MTNPDDLVAIESEIRHTRMRLHELRAQRELLRRAVPQPVQPLRRKLSGESPLEFAKQVAEQYKLAALRTHEPAVELASASGVPVGTVRRWIREARALGELPPGHQGRAG
jgi:hypothetical protein